MKAQRVAGEPVLRLDGEFDVGAEALLKPALSQLLADLGAGTDPVVLDMANVRYMDSAGFSVWVRLEQIAEHSGRGLRVRGAPALIRDLFTYADLEEVLLP